MFESSVHTQNIPNVEKFAYLKGSLKGKAAEAIEGIKQNNENYDIVIGILQKRCHQATAIQSIGSDTKI